VAEPGVVQANGDAQDWFNDGALEEVQTGDEQHDQTAEGSGDQEHGLAGARSDDGAAFGGTEGGARRALLGEIFQDGAGLTPVLVEVDIGVKDATLGAQQFLKTRYPGPGFGILDAGGC
jgi:hypothetical protein